MTPKFQLDFTGKNLPPPTFPSAMQLLDDFAQKHKPDASKEVEDLTGDEKMALCILARVPLKFDDGAVRTSVMCGIYKVAGEFRVLQDTRPQHGTKVTFQIPDRFSQV